ncbi:MAG: UDP-N-acetylglucosamine 2-epimerase [Methanobacterium sp.]
MKRKILYITGTRADYGLMLSVLFEIQNCDSLNLEIIVTGMHLMEEFGMTVNEIVEDGFDYHILNAVFEEDNKISMAKFVGRIIYLLTGKINDINPDLILLLGDRGEMLAGAIVGAYLNIPTAHLHGGEITSTVDEYVRHAITKLVNIHFPATQKSAERIWAMGENPEDIYLVGAPGLDYILNLDLSNEKEIIEKYNLEPFKPLILMIQHPVTLESKDASKQISETLNAISDLEYQTLIIYPNADAGGREMIKEIKEYEHLPFIQSFKNIPRKDFISLMKIVSVMVGNSSSGIIEAPSFKIPVVNVGSRQENRERAQNVLDVDYNKEEIKNAIETALYDDDFRMKVENCQNPYGEGNTAIKIVEILKNINIDDNLLNKALNYD